MAEGVVLVLGVVQAVVVARLLGPTEFGRAALVTAYPTLLFAVLDPQSGQAVVHFLSRYVASDRPDLAAALVRLAYMADLLLSAAAFILVAGSAVWLGNDVIRHPDAALLLVVYSGASCVVAPAATSRAVLGTLNDFRGQAVVRAGAAVVRTALVLMLVAAGAGITGFVFGSAVGLIVDGIATVALANRAIRGRLGRPIRRAKVRELGSDVRDVVRFIAYTDATTVVTSLMKQADTVLIGLLRGPTDAGYYRLALAVSSPLGNAMAPLQAVVYPRITAVVGHVENAEVLQLLRRYFWRLGLPIAVAIGLVVPAVPFAIQVFAGAPYADAARPAQLLLSASAVSLAFFWARPAVLALGRVRFLLVNGTVVSLVSVAAFYVFTPRFGPTGMATVRLVIGAVIGHLLFVGFVLRDLRANAARPASQQGEDGRSEAIPRASDDGLPNVRVD